MLTLRDYQFEAVAAVQSELQKVRSTCVIWATGLGKTALAAEIIRQWHPLPTLFICERRELVHQSAQRISEHCGVQCQIEQGGYHTDPNHWFDRNFPVVASIQSLNSAWGSAKRMHKFKPRLVIVDEFHHSTAPSYEKLFNYVGPETKLLGLSATPKRLDGKSLGKHFQTVAHRMEIKEAIEKGWLCDIAQQYVKIQGLDYSKIHTVRGDLDRVELSKIMEVEQVIQKMAEPSLEIIFGVPQGSLQGIPQNEWEHFLRTNGHEPFRTIMFCASVAHAALASEVFNRAVPHLFDWVSAKTNEEERPEKIAAFKSGKVPCMANMGIFGEGVDVPAVELILQARATKSLSLWIQQMGRGTRTLPGVIDGLNTPEERIAAIRSSKKPYVRVVDFVGNSGRHKLISSVDVLGGELTEDVKARAIEEALKKGRPVKMAVTLSNVDKQVKHEEEVRQHNLKHVVAASNYKSKEVNPFEQGNQINFWKKTAKQVIPASFKQLKVIGRAGIPTAGLDKKRASFFIGILSKNNWRLPQEYEWIRRWNQPKAAA